MVVAPDILGDVERQSLSPDATLRRESTLDIAPAPFQSVDVCAVATAKLAQIMLHQAMHRALGRDAGIEVQGIGPDDRAAAHVRANQGIPRFDGQIGHDLRPRLPASAEDAEDRRVPCAAPAGAPALSTRGSPIAPATAHRGLVDLDGPLKDRRHIALQRTPHDGPRPQHPFSPQAGFVSDGLGAHAPHEPSPHLPPIAGGQAQRQPPRPPVVPALAATASVAAQDPVFRVSTPWAFQPPSHPATV